MSTDFTEGEPLKSGSSPKPMSTGLSEGAPRRVESCAEPEEVDDDRVPNLRLPLAATDEDRWIALCAHVGGYFLWILVPLILLLTQKDRRSFVAWHAREALNFNICLMAYSVLLATLTCLMFVDWWMFLIPIALLLLLGLIQLVAVILASIAAYRGLRSRCLLTIRLIPHPPTIE